jgi:molybdenum cofactor cytidylyltransferase
MRCVHEAGQCTRPRLWVSAIVLAAGAGQRMGGVAKCLLKDEQGTLIEQQIRALQEAGANEITVVLGHFGDAVAANIAAFGVCSRKHSREDHSQFDSLQLGVGEISSEAQAVLVVPADMPLLGSEHYIQAIAAFKKRPEHCFYSGPWCRETPGHPVVFEPNYLRAKVSSPRPIASGNWRSRDDPEGWHWSTDDSRFTVDIDRPEDLRDLRHKWQKTLS